MDNTLIRQPVLRLGIVRKVNFTNQTASVQLIDKADTRLLVCPLPHPFAGGNTGIFVSPVPNTTYVLINYSFNERPFIVATVPTSSISNDYTLSFNTDNIPASNLQVASLSPGEISIKGFDRSEMRFSSSGSVHLTFGNSKYLYDSRDFVIQKHVNYYSESASHRVVSGEIRRDLRPNVPDSEKYTDHMTDPSYEGALSTISRNPLFTPALVTNDDRKRNPPLNEHRTVVYEFSRPYSVSSESDEKVRYQTNFVPSDDYLNRLIYRDSTRTDVLNQNQVQANNLSEIIHGTVVDYYGNVLDINRNKIDFSHVQDSKTISQEYKLLRRSIKYHFEINSKKDDSGESLLKSLDGFDIKNGHSHSRWSIDVDGEGLTKINIPASSNIGNIPLLSRYVNSSLLNDNHKFSYRDSSKTDVFHLQFGDMSSDGVAIDAKYAPSNLGSSSFKYRTAFHDIIETAAPLFSSGQKAVNTTIINDIFAAGANAGGRSVHLNLDGSLELNVGRDVIDHKSIVIDTSGGIISRIGKDRRDNSIVSQIDGNIKMMVGGDSVENDSRVAQPNVKFYVKGSTGMAEIEIRDGAIYITSAPNKNIVIASSNNLILSAKNQTLVHGESVGICGTYDEPGNITHVERHLARNGVII